MSDVNTDSPIQQDHIEQWKPVPQFEDFYEVSNMGRIRTRVKRMRYEAGLVLAKRQIPQGYCYVRLSNDGQKKTFYVHRLVLAAFNPIEGCEKLDVNHLNGQRDDNRLVNLEWLSHKDNLHYSMRVLGTFKGFRPSDTPKPPKILKGRTKGEAQKAAKLNANKVREIRHLCDTGMKQKDIAKMFGVSESVIGQIKKRTAWAHIE